MIDKGAFAGAVASLCRAFSIGARFGRRLTPEDKDEIGEIAAGTRIRDILDRKEKEREGQDEEEL